MLRPARPGPAAPRVGPPAAEDACGERGAALSQPAPRPPALGAVAAGDAGECRAARHQPRGDGPPRSPKVPGAGESGDLQSHIARAPSSRPVSRGGGRTLGFSATAASTAPEGHPRARPQPTRLAPQVPGAGDLGVPQPRTSRALSSRSLGSLRAAPDRVRARETVLGTLPLAKAKEKEKFARPRPGSPRAGRRRASRGRVLPQRGLASSIPGAAAAVPAPAAAASLLAGVTTRPPGSLGSRRDPSAALPAPGAHTHSRSLARTHTRSHAPEGSAAAAAASAGSGGRRGRRGARRRGRRAGRRPIKSTSSRPLASKVLTPGKKKS